MSKQLSLTSKIAITPIIGVALVLALAAIFATSLDNQRKTLSAVTETEFSQAIELDNIFYKISHLHNQLHDVLTEVENESDEEVIYVSGKPLIEALHLVSGQIKAQGKIEKFDKSDKVIYQKVRNALSNYHYSAVSAIDKASLNWKLAEKHLANADKYFIQASHYFHELSSRLKQQAQKKLTLSLEKSESSLDWFVLTAAGALALMVVVAVAFSRNLLNSIRRITGAITTLASADKPSRATTQYDDQKMQSVDEALNVLSGKLIELEQETKQRQRVESELALAAKFFENASDGIVVTDKENNILAINPAFSAITGFTEEEVVGQGADFFSAYYEGYDEIWLELQANSEWQGEIFQRNKEGDLKPAWLTISSVQDDENDDHHYVSVFMDTTALKDSQARVEYIAQHDALTGLPNRPLFIERLKHAINRARREMKHLSVLFIDLDRFKMINDTHGHLLGDELLKEVASRIGQVLRADDTLARLGGDEFILLLEGASTMEGANKVAGKILRLLSQPVCLDGKELVVTTSIGIASYPADGDDAMTLIRNADTAMYQAKDHGRDRYYSYTSELTADALRKFALERDLRQALSENQLSVHYQPQVGLVDGAVLGFEALVRWQHPQRGWVSPADFIPLAEDIGVIEQVGDFVLSQVCEQIRLWRECGLGEYCVSVNISAKQLMNPFIVQRITSLLDEHGNAIDTIEVEVTESSVMEHADLCIGVLHSLHKLGIPIAVDDFGTGYSSLSYLKRLPVQKLKIDRAFIRDLPDDEEDGKLVAAIIALAHSLGLFVVGEGVENQAQLDFLKDCGCNSVQGYYLGKPMSVVDAEDWLRAKINTSVASLAG